MVAPFFKQLFAKRTALQRLGAPTPIVTDDGEREARAIVEELRAAPIETRVKNARDGGLPKSALKLGPHARVVFEVLIDDDLLRQALGVDTVVAWCAHDSDACTTYAIARMDRFAPELVWQVLVAIEDASEIYDVFAPLFRANEAGARALMGSIPFLNDTAREVFADPRMVDLAVGTLARDVRTSCFLLGLNGSSRAVDELRAVLERVPADEERTAATEEEALAAIDGLSEALQGDAFIDVLARFSSAQPKRLVPHMYLSMRIAQYAIALGQHPLVQANPSLRAAVEQTSWPPPLPAG